MNEKYLNITTAKLLEQLNEDMNILEEKDPLANQSVEVLKKMYDRSRIETKEAEAKKKAAKSAAMFAKNPKEKEALERAQVAQAAKEAMADKERAQARLTYQSEKKKSANMLEEYGITLEELIDLEDDTFDDLTEDVNDTEEMAAGEKETNAINKARAEKYKTQLQIQLDKTNDQYDKKLADLEFQKERKTQQLDDKIKKVEMVTEEFEGLEDLEGDEDMKNELDEAAIFANFREKRNDKKIEKLEKKKTELSMKIANLESKEPDQKVEQIDNSIFSGKIGSIIKILINDSLVYDKDLVEPLKKMKSDSQAIFYITKIKKELAKETPDKNILREMKTKLNGIFLKIK